ncbi:MAG TPA: DUF1850 domain-containing protein [Solirubrobacteraceae bacterium]|nr:DUF1850 domain-containing protein [Solirubrobacteraceae bacterium]
MARAFRPGLVLLAGLLGVVMLSGCGGRTVVVRSEGGDVLVRADVPASGRFALEYLHSYYREPARESFTVDGSGFAMVEVASPSEAVLDYYELAGRKRPGGWMRLTPARPRHFERLALIATATGRRTLAVGGRRYPLFAGAAPRHITIEVQDATWP